MTDERRIERLILNRDPRPEQKQKRRTLKGELDSFQDMVQNKLEAGLGDLFRDVNVGTLGPMKKVKLKDKVKDVKKRILKAKGASPGRIKAEFGEEMADGGVVDLTTEMEVNE